MLCSQLSLTVHYEKPIRYLISDRSWLQEVNNVYKKHDTITIPLVVIFPVGIAIIILEKDDTKSKPVRHADDDFDQINT